MDLPGEANYPTESEFSVLAQVRFLLEQNGRLFSIANDLSKTPKPWPANVRRARNTALVALGKGIHAYKAIPAYLREAAGLAAEN